MALHKRKNRISTSELSWALCLLTALSSCLLLVRSGYRDVFRRGYRQKELPAGTSAFPSDADCTIFRTAFSRLPEGDTRFRLAWTFVNYDGPPLMWTAPYSATDFWLSWSLRDANGKEQFNDMVASIKELARMVDSLKASHPEASVIIDGGANMGQEAILFGVQGYEIFSFEPLKSQYENLLFNLEINCVPNVRAFNNGLGESSALVCLAEGESDQLESVSPQANLNSFIKRNGDEIRLCPPSQVLNITTVDAVVTRNIKNRPVFYKLDCEGCEYSALQGSTILFDKYPPYLVNREVHPGEPAIHKLGETIEFLLARNYELYFLGPSDTLLGAEYPAEYWSDWRSRPISDQSGPSQYCDACGWELIGVHSDARKALHMPARQ